MYKSLNGPSGASLAAMPWMTRRVCDEGVELVKEFEGLRLTPYRCPGRVWTIGYGHTRTVHPDMKITKAEAEQLLREDMAVAARGVMRLVTVPLDDCQFAALVSFVFNVGLGNFEKSSMLTLLNKGWYEQVPAQLLRWNKAGGVAMGGLTRRRRAEIDLWNRGESS